MSIRCTDSLQLRAREEKNNELLVLARVFNALICTHTYRSRQRIRRYIYVYVRTSGAGRSRITRLIRLNAPSTHWQLPSSSSIALRLIAPTSHTQIPRHSVQCICFILVAISSSSTFRAVCATARMCRGVYIGCV